jgi:hypothetical protein
MSRRGEDDDGGLRLPGTLAVHPRWTGSVPSLASATRAIHGKRFESHAGGPATGLSI